MKKFAIVFAAVAAISAPAMAAPGHSSSASGNANAKVVGPLTITHDAGASLNFGAFTAGDGGMITIQQAGGGFSSQVWVFDEGETISRDSFTVTGAPGRTFGISAGSGTLTRTGGSETMSFTTSVPSSGTLPATAGEPFTFFVGGTLTVGANQEPGDYAGTYSVTVTYN